MLRCVHKSPDQIVVQSLPEHILNFSSLSEAQKVAKRERKGKGQAFILATKVGRQRLAAEEVAGEIRPVIKVAGVCGPFAQALAEAELAASLGYDLGLLSMGGLADLSEGELIKRAEAVAEIIPAFGFYLQPAVGGRRLSYGFWRDFAELPGVMAIKIAPFDRYGTLDVVRAVCRSSRRDDDNIVADLLTSYAFEVGGRRVEKAIVGGLLGHWAVWTRRAVELLGDVKRARESGQEHAVLLARGVAITDANAASFDAAHDLRGFIAGIHEVLRRQGLSEGSWCLDPEETLSPGQLEEIDRIYQDDPESNDDIFVREHLEAWLSGP
jgi:hypothetical protein